MRIIVIEDNPEMATIVKRTLECNDHVADVCVSGFDGEVQAASGTYDMIVLDLMLPDRDGMDICRGLRRHGIRTPILILTALCDTERKVMGLRAGADDYVTKPFNPDEFLARIDAVARRSLFEEESKLRFNDLEMDLLKRQVSRDGQLISLTVKEFQLLEYFLRNPHRVLTRSQLGTRIWDIDYQDSSNVIEVYVSRLRKKIDRPFGRTLIHTAVGMGYMLSDE